MDGTAEFLLFCLVKFGPIDVDDNRAVLPGVVQVLKCPGAGYVGLASRDVDFVVVHESKFPEKLRVAGEHHDAAFLIDDEPNVVLVIRVVDFASFGINDDRAVGPEIARDGDAGWAELKRFHGFSQSALRFQ